MTEERAASVHSSHEEKSPMTWQSFSSLIAQAVHNLKESIRQGQKGDFIENTTTIVHRIRLLLYATDCLDKETSSHLKTNKQLRSHHRSLLAALAKLVLSTRIASGAWPTTEALAKLQVDSDDILISVRSFMICAQEYNVEIKESKPILLCDTSNMWRNSPFVIKNSNGISVLGKSDVVTATLILADNVRGAMHSFMESVCEAFSNYENKDLSGTLVKLKANTPLLVAQFRNLNNTTSHFLNAIEEVCQSQQGNRRSLILVNAKQPMYAAMGALFVVSQTITSSDLDADKVGIAYERLQQYSQVIGTSIQDVVEASQSHMEDLVNGLQDEGAESVTPTQQRQYSNGSLRQYTSPTPHPTSVHEEEEKPEEIINKRNDIGLGALLANPTGHFMDESILGGDRRSETSSIESDEVSVRHAKDTKITKFFGEDVIAAARRRDTLTTTPTLPTTTSSVVSGSTYTTSPAMTGASTNLISGIDTPWFLIAEIDPNEMIFNMEGNVKGGSLHGLVQRLTQHDQLDSAFNSTFLLTYRSFCTTAELFDELFQRYQLAPPDELTPEELDMWKEKKLKLVRLR